MGESRVAAVSDVPEGEIVGLEVDGRPVALANEGGTIHAFHNDCSHMHCTLDDGELEDGHVHCACHDSAFDLRTGAPTQLPATEPITIYPVRIEGDDVFVTLE